MRRPPIHLKDIQSVNHQSPRRDPNNRTDRKFLFSRVAAGGETRPLRASSPGPEHLRRRLAKPTGNSVRDRPTKPLPAPSSEEYTRLRIGVNPIRTINAKRKCVTLWLAYYYQCTRLNLYKTHIFGDRLCARGSIQSGALSVKSNSFN
jgi:hypothetical protein